MNYVAHKAIGAAQLHAELDAVLTDVEQERMPYIIARDEQPRAVLLPYEDFLQLLALAPQDEDNLRAFDRLRARMAEVNGQYSEEEIEADIEAARAEVWEERMRAQAAGTA